MKEYKTIIGIDGGKNGAFAVSLNGKLRVVKMPKDTKKLKQFLENYDPEGAIVFLEKVSAFVGEDDSKKFGIIKMLGQVRELKTVLEYQGFTVIEIASITWQTRLKLRSKGEKEEKEIRKEKYYQFAKRWAPYTKIHKYQGDAVCVLACGIKMIKEKDPLITGKGNDLDLF